MNKKPPPASGTQRHLAIYAGLILSVTMCTGSQGADPKRLAENMRRAAEAGDWNRAIELGKQVADLLPKEPAPAYNLACVFARSGDADSSVKWLKAAGERGFYYVSTFLRDEDLYSIRGHESYPIVLETFRRNSAAALERFKPNAEKATVITIAPPKLDKSKPAPLIVALHGRGGNAKDMVGVWRKVAGEIGAVLVAPQAVQPLGNGGFDWGVVEQGEYLVLRAIEKTRADFNIDPAKIIVTGFSQGGAMTFTLTLRYPTQFVGAIPVAGEFDQLVVPIPEKTTRLPRFVIMNGLQDDAVENNRDAARRLEAIGSPVLLKLYEGVGHGFPQNRDAELKKAVEFVLNGE